MTDEVEEEGGEDESSGEGGGSGGGLKKLILFVVLPIVLLAGGGAGLYFSGMLDSMLGIEAEDAHKEEKVEEDTGPGHYMQLDEILVTLSGKGRKQSFLKMRISLELENAEAEARITAVMPRIIDNFQVFLRELRVEELQGSQGMYRVKEELLSRVNAAARPVKVKDILIGEILVQ
ncbi:MAG: flagellar basal body-associated FliL family protein [Alphaproteobacteria bacterium]|nr:flagellar basal body-associated FliL family protein [Alphaproteobacteria bacterium]